MIIYEVIGSSQKSKAELKVTYGRNHIKGETFRINSQTGKIIDSSTTIYDITNGICYDINPLSQIVEFDSLKYAFTDDIGVEFLPLDSFKKIENYNCRFFSAKVMIEDTLAIMPTNKFVIWFSEDLKYIIPKDYRNKRSLLCNNEGNSIWLESRITFLPPSKYGDSVMMWMKAKSIIPMKVNDSLFKLPENFNFKYSDRRKNK